MSDPIASLPPLRDIIADHDLRATKSLGQNFLCDLNLTRKIARTAQICSSDHIIEIGPGPGGLTRGILLEGGHHVTAIEFDERAIHALQSLSDAAGDRLVIIHADALKENLLHYGVDGQRKIVANLPYNIATPLLIQWFRHIHDNAQNAYQSMTVMLQKEVAQRLCATTNDKHYGRLSILAQWLCDARVVFDVPPNAFVPPPKVTSSIVHLVPKTRTDNIPFAAVEKITETAFGQRRKMIRQSMKPYLKTIHNLGIDETLRAENLTIGNFLDIARDMTS